MNVGDLIKIKRIWINHPPSYLQGIILSIKTTRWDKNYRIIKLLKTDGTIVDEPLDIVRDINCYEIIA
jgi:hypothetical protein